MLLQWISIHCKNKIKISKENTNASSIVSKVWAFCQMLRDDMDRAYGSLVCVMCYIDWTKVQP